MNMSISKLSRKITLAFTATLVMSTATAFTSPILFIDDDRGLAGNTTWFTTLSNLGYSYDVETLGANGNPTANLSDYSTVIWSIGDQAYTNLTSANVTAMQSYLDAGGSLLYAGGHSLFYEPNAGTLAANYFGVSNYNNNMPTFGTTTMSGTGHDITGTDAYNVSPWPRGSYGYSNMMTGFSLTTAEGMLSNPVGSVGGPFVAAVNMTSEFSAMVWGFDLNQMSDQGQRERLLDASLTYLSPSSVPEPAPLALLGLGLLGLGIMRKRRS